MYLIYSEDTSIFLIINSKKPYLFYLNLEFIANHLYRAFYKYIRC